MSHLSPQPDYNRLAAHARMAARYRRTMKTEKPAGGATPEEACREAAEIWIEGLRLASDLRGAGEPSALIRQLIATAKADVRRFLAPNRREIVRAMYH